jgi:hypothetical protein
MTDQRIGANVPEEIRVATVSGTIPSAINNLLGENVPPSSTLLIVIVPANGKDYFMQVAEQTQSWDV